MALTPAMVWAQEPPVQSFRSTDLPLPRFASLRSDKVYARAGPATRYPVKWLYQRDGLPVEVIQEFEHWRKIRDFDGGEGWIHKTLLSGDRLVMVQAQEPAAMHEGQNDSSRILARLEPRVIAHADKCAGEWCRLSVDGYQGWVKRNFLWGIYEVEELN
jgi:SH3-like domain-containing protein